MRAEDKERCQRGAGSHWGCGTCWVWGYWDPEIKRVIYTGYRRHLAMDAEWRTDADWQDSEGNTVQEHRGPPPPRCSKEIRAYGEARSLCPETHGTQTDPVVATGVKGVSAMFKAHDLMSNVFPDYFNDMHVVEMMHLVTNTNKYYIDMANGLVPPFSLEDMVCLP